MLEDRLTGLWSIAPGASDHNMHLENMRFRIRELRLFQPTDI